MIRKYSGNANRRDVIPMTTMDGHTRLKPLSGASNTVNVRMPSPPVKHYRAQTEKRYVEDPHC